MQTSEWLLTGAVILVPLLIAVTVTLWSLEQARYRPKKRRPPGIRRNETERPDEENRGTAPRTSRPVSREP